MSARTVLLLMFAVAVVTAILFFTAVQTEDPVVNPVQRQAPDIDVRAPMERRTLFHDGIEREFFVHVPPVNEASLPVVVALHGYTSTATGFQAANNLNAHADEHSYIVVYPQGSHFRAETPDGQMSRVTSWNDLAANLGPKGEGPHCMPDAVHYPCPPECGSCNRCAWTSCYDDVGFVARMLDAVHTEFPTDETRTYVLGVSNGGMMALRLGCNLSQRFVAVATIIGQLAPGYACGPGVDVPMLHLYGGRDDVVRPDGKPAADGFLYTTAAKTASVWAQRLACEAGPARWENQFAAAAGLQCTAFADCRIKGHEVVSCMDPVAAHEWPSQGFPDIPATCVTPEQYASLPDQPHCPPATGQSARLGMDLLWDFFRRY